MVSRSRTVNPPHGDLVLSGVSIWTSPYLCILDVKFGSRLTFKHHVFCVSQKNCILMLVKCVFVDPSVLLHCYSAFVLLILEYFSPVWGSAAEFHLQLLKCQVYSVSRPCPDQTFFLLCHQHHVAALCMLYKVNLYFNHCLLSELPFASVRV